MKYLKLLLFAFISISIMAACNNESKTQDSNYHITGKIAGSTDGQVFIKVRGDNGWETIDSATITNGEFKMDGHIKDVRFGYLTSSTYKGGIPIFVENDHIHLEMNKDSVAQAIITGTNTQKVYNDAKANLTSFDKIWQDFYYSTFKAMTDEEKGKSEGYLNHLYDSAQLVKKDYLKEYLSTNKGNIASAQLILDEEDALGADNMIAVFDVLEPSVLESIPGKQLNDRVTIIKKTAIGQPLVDFVMNDTAGKPIRISEASHGKYVLLDFWAAWCSPCRHENPNVLANYKKYHDAGFDVIGISFDQKKQNWLKAIQDDGLLWTQVSDLQGWNNAAGKLYGIRSIPQNILLNPEGTIIEKNLRGEALGKKLESLFAK